MSLELIPITLKDAHALVLRWHRHHKPCQGALFAVAVAKIEVITFDGGNAGEGWREDCEPVGAAIIGRPVSRMLDNGWTAEVVRCVTDGTPNACSMLYQAAWRACRALGFKKLVTYTLSTEGGASLRGAGWKCIGQAGGGSWDRIDRPRVDQHPTQMKLRWERSS